MAEAGTFASSATEGPILVVDDDPRIRDLLRWMLEEEGLAVAVAADGQEALERLAARRPSLVLLDMALPLVDGAAVATRIKEIYGQTLPIVVMTADGRAAEHDTLHVSCRRPARSRPFVLSERRFHTITPSQIAALLL